MIYIVIILFLLPIFLKTIQNSSFTFKILFPTLITYSIWFIFSYGLISFSINSQYYLYFFYPFPFALLIYELYITFKKRYSLIFNKYLLYLFLFLIINLLINIFTYKYIVYDDVSYMKWTIDAFKQNAFISDTTYKFNTFYYLATMFGNYKITTFYSVLSTYIIGTIIYIFLFQIIKEKFANLKKWPFVILLSLLISAYVNSSWSLQINWSIGFTIVMGYLLIFMKLNREKYLLINDLFLDALLIFSLNFSATGIVVSILLWIFLKGYIYLKYNKVSHIFLVFFICLYILNISLAFSRVASIVLYIAAISCSLFLLIIYFMKLELDKNESKIINFFVKFNKYLDENYWLYKWLFLNFIIFSYAALVIIVDIDIHNVDWRNLIISISISILFINLLLITKQYELLVVLCVILFTWSIYSGVLLINSRVLFDYIPSRVKYVFFAMTLFFGLITFISMICDLKWDYKSIAKKTFYMFGSISLLFTVINNRLPWLIDARLTSKINTQLSEQNFKLLEKYMNTIYDGNTFSMYHIPFNREKSWLYYNGMLYKQNEEPHQYFGQWLNGRDEYIKWYINQMYYLVEDTIYYKILILDNNSPLIHNSHVMSNYIRQKDQTKEMSIWLLK